FDSEPLPKSATASSTEEGRWYVVSYMALSLSTVNGVPDAIGRRRHFEFVVADRIRDRVDHGSRCADRAGLATTLDAEPIARTQRRGVVHLERRQIVGAR